jgi:head-tail adaptor
VQIGALRHRVTIEAPYPGKDDAGALVEGWGELGQLWAEVRTPAGLERAAPEVDQLRATVTHTVRIRRAHFTITPACRVIWGMRVLEVVAVTDPDNRGASQLLLCVEQLPPVVYD